MVTKGQKQIFRTENEKYEIIKPILENIKSQNQVSKETGINIQAQAGAYGSHYDIMKNFDLVVLAPQINSYLADIQEDAGKIGVKVVATKGAEYIKLTRDPKGAVDFVLAQV